MSLPTCDFTFERPAPTSDPRMLWNKREREQAERYRLDAIQWRSRALQAEEVNKANPDVLQASLRNALNNKIKYSLTSQRNTNKYMEDKNKQMEEKDVQIDDYFNRIAAKEGEIEQFKKTISENEQQHKSLTRTVKMREAEIVQKDKEISKRDEKIESLRAQLLIREDDLAHQRGIGKDIQDHLNKMKEDFDQLHAEKMKVESESNVWQLTCKDVTARLESLRAEWEEDQSRVDELEAVAEQAPALQVQINELELELDSLKQSAEEAQRAIVVRDERIAGLERDVQKKMEQLARMQALRDVESDPVGGTITPAKAKATAVGDSLEQEMEALGEDWEEDEEEPQNLGFSGITTILDTAPTAPTFQASALTGIIVQAPTETKNGIEHGVPAISSTETKRLISKLSISSIQSVDTRPLAPMLSFASISSVATEPIDPEVTTSNIATQTEGIEPEVTTSNIATQTKNIEPEIATASIAVQTSPVVVSFPVKAVSMGIQTDPEDQPAPIEVVSMVTQTESEIPVELTSIGVQTDSESQPVPIDVSSMSTQTDPEDQTIPTATTSMGTQTPPFVAEAAPVTPASMSTQTHTIADAQPIPITVTSTSTRTDPIKLDFSNVTRVETHAAAPISFSPTPHRLTITFASAIETSPVAGPAIPPRLVTLNKLSTFQKVFVYFGIPILLMALSLWMNARAWADANRTTYGHGSSGAFGTSAHFLGIPIGKGIGGSGFEENVSRVVEGVVQRVEDWVGGRGMGLM